MGTENGSLGLLDIATHKYTTVLRSHTDSVNALAVDSSGKHLVTASSDSTIRIWNLVSHQQMCVATPCCIKAHKLPSRSQPRAGLSSYQRKTWCCRYEFEAPGEAVLCVACHPVQDDVACGFSSGIARIFHVPTTSLIKEFKLHRTGVKQVR